MKLNYLIKYFVLSLAILSPASVTYAADLVATVDRQNISINETLLLKITYDAESLSGEPDLRHLEEDFEILSRHQSNKHSYSSFNNSLRSLTEWEMNLAPKRTGTLLIPSFSYKGEFSDALEIVVSESGQLPAGRLDEVFFSSEVDKQSPFVQEQIIYTQRLASAIPLSNYNIEPLDVPGAVVTKLAEHQYQKQIKNTAYTVLEWKYAVFPQNSGELLIPPVQFTAVRRDYSDPFGFNNLQGSGSKMVRLASAEHHLNILSKPENFSGNSWLPAENIQLDLRWSQSPSEFKVGEAITRTVTITSTGIGASLLPPLSDTALDSIKTYSENPQMKDEVTAYGIKGTRIETLAMVPTQAGEITLPPVKLAWWDTVNQREKIAEIPGQTINVLPADVISAAPAINTNVASTAPAPVINTSGNLRYWQITTVWLRISTAVCPAVAAKKALLQQSVSLES